MRDLIDRFGPYWSKHLSYNFHMAMFYRVCYTVLTTFGDTSVFYLAFTDKERITPIAYGRRLDDFDLYLDKVQLYFVRTTPVKYRMYLETMFCKTYGEKVRAAFHASENIRCYGKNEVFEIANFPKEAFEKYLKRTREYKQVTYNGKVYSMWKLRKYLNESENIFDPSIYKKTYFCEPVDIDDVPDRDPIEEDEFCIDNQMIYIMLLGINETFGINKKVYIAYFDRDLKHPVGIGLNRYDMQFYQKRLKKLYYVETTPIRFMYYIEERIFHPEHEYFFVEQRRNEYFNYYVILKSFAEGREIFDFVIDEGVTIRYLLDKRFYKKYANQRERLLKKCIEIFKIKDDFFNYEFYKTTNLMKFINYSKIPFVSDYRRED